MELGLANKVALVTASSKGMGKAVAMGLAQEGCNIALCARNEEQLHRTVHEIHKSTKAEVIALPCDLSNREEIHALVEKTINRWGTIDILITNAGGPPLGSIFDFSEEDWNKAYQLTLMSVVRLQQLVLPLMKDKKWGRIISILSTSVKQPIPYLLLSNVFRAGVASLNKSLATEFAPFGITINTVCPGMIATDRHEQLIQERMNKESKTREEIINSYARIIPMQRAGTPEEFAQLVLFLCSERASYITGTTVQVDGGLVKTIM